MITQDIKETQRLRSGDLLILTSKEEGCKALLKATKLAGMPINVEEHKFLNSSKGVIYSHDLMYVELEEITKELQNQNVVKVERIKRKINGELKDTPLHILTFNTIELPNDIKAGFLKLDVRIYLPNPMRCHNCQKYGHTKTRCFRVPICPKCSKEIPNGHEDILCDPIKCANCNNNHTTFDYKCPTFLMEKEIIRIKTMDRITYIRAKDKYIRENANTTGANRNANTPKIAYSEILKNNTDTKQRGLITSTKNTKKNNNNPNNNNSTSNNKTNEIDKNNSNNNLIKAQQNEIEKPKTNETTSKTKSNNENEKNNTNNETTTKQTTEERMNLITRKYSFLSPAELNIAIDIDE